MAFKTIGRLYLMTGLISFKSCYFLIDNKMISKTIKCCLSAGTVVDEIWVIWFRMDCCFISTVAKLIINYILFQ